MRHYCEEVDCYFDSNTGLFLESKCKDIKCEFCSKRPLKHSPHKWEWYEGWGICE